jgi:hypothetical protein
VAGHAKASSERCPSWRQLYRITATLCEAAGIDSPKSAADASALIAQLDAIANGPEAAPCTHEDEAAPEGDGIPF